jgi:hypothetical protein
MDGAGDEFLARPGLATDENGGLELGDLPYGPKEIQHLRTACHEIAEAGEGFLAPRANLFVQSLVLAEQPLALLGLAQEQNDLVGLEGLGDVVVRATLHSLDGDVPASVSGHHDDRGTQVSPPNFVDQVHAALPRHAQVGDDDVVGPVRELF